MGGRWRSKVSNAVAVIIAMAFTGLTACGAATTPDEGGSSESASTNSRLGALLGVLRTANRAAEAEAKPLRGAGRALLEEMERVAKQGDEAAVASSFKGLFGYGLPNDISPRTFVKALGQALGQGKAPGTAHATARAVVADHTVVAILENMDDLAAALKAQGGKDTGVYELLLAALWRTEKDLDSSASSLSSAERMLSRPTDSGLRELGAASGLDARALDRVASIVDDVADVRRAPYTQAGKMLRFIESNSHAALTFGADGATGPMVTLAKRMANDDVNAFATLLVQFAESAATLRNDSGFGAALLRKTKGFREMELRAERTQRALLRLLGEEQAAALALGDAPKELVGILGTSTVPVKRASDLLAALADEFEASYELVIDQLNYSRHANKHLSAAVKTVDDAKRVALSSEGQYLPKYHDDAARQALEKAAVLTGIRDPHGSGTDYFWHRAAEAVGAGEDGELTRWIRVEVTSGLQVHSHPRPFESLPARVKAAVKRVGLEP